MHIRDLDASSANFHTFLKRLHSMPKQQAQALFNFHQSYISDSERYRNLLRASGETHSKLLESAQQWNMHEDAQFLRTQIEHIREKTAWLSETVIKSSYKISESMLTVIGVEHLAKAGPSDGIKNRAEDATMDRVFQEMEAHLKHTRVAKRALPPAQNTFKLSERPMQDALRLKGTVILQRYYSSLIRKHQASLGTIY